MATSKASLRRSVSLPSQVARRVEAIAKRERTSSSRVIVELIETGLEARDRQKQEFFELADRLVRSSDASEQARLKEELARRTFGD
jgi:metal-responsive CopG/Arc/MetJ family transcriptional regulator